MGYGSQKKGRFQILTVALSLFFVMQLQGNNTMYSIMDAHYILE